MLKSFKQTTVFWRKNSSLQFTGFEAPPIPPAGLLDRLSENCAGVKLKSFDGQTEYIWWHNGNVEKRGPTEEIIWHRKPTIADAVNYSLFSENRGAVFQFHRGGEVTAYCFGDKYFWSTEAVAAEPVEGYSVGGNWCSDGEFRFEDDPLCQCPPAPWDCRCEVCEGYTTSESESDWDECDRCEGRGSAGGGCPDTESGKRRRARRPSYC